MEFGLIAVPLLLLLVGIIQFSVWFWAYQVGSHAAREGARYAAVHPCDDADIANLVTARIGDAAATITAGPSVTRLDDGDGTTNPGDEVTVSVGYDIFEIGLFSMPGVSKAATARIEHIPTGSTC